MAKVKLSGLISDIRGKLGGSFFQNTSTGLVIKNVNYNPIRKSFSKSDRLSKAHLINSYWSALSVNHKDNWSAFSLFAQVQQKKNKSLFLSGKDLFFKVNFYRLLYSHAILEIPVFAKNVYGSITGILSIVAGNLTFTTSRVVIPTFEYIILKITPPLNTSINSAQSRMRVIVFPTVTNHIYNIQTPYLNVFNRSAVSGNALIFSYTTANLQTGLIYPFINQKIIL